MAAYRRVYDSRHLQADCQEAGSAPEPYALESIWATFLHWPIKRLGRSGTVMEIRDETADRRQTDRVTTTTLARPYTSSSLRITDRFFQHASPRPCKQLPASLRQPRTKFSSSDSPSPLSGTSSIGPIHSRLSSSIAPSLFSSQA